MNSKMFSYNSKSKHLSKYLQKSMTMHSLLSFGFMLPCFSFLSIHVLCLVILFSTLLFVVCLKREKRQTKLLK